jgi:hypothetical protein
MASYDGAMLKVTELFSRAIQSTANVCLWRLHGCMLNFIHMSASGVAEIAKSTNFEGVSTYFAYIVYMGEKCTEHRLMDHQNDWFMVSVVYWLLKHQYKRKEKRRNKYFF